MALLARIPALKRWTASAWAILISNAVAPFGVMVLGWEVASLLFFYWLETLVIGGFTVVRIMFAGLGASDTSGADAWPRLHWAARIFLVPFFCVHYGMFCMGHGFFLGTIFLNTARFGLLDPLPLAFSLLENPVLLLLPVIAGHAVSFWMNDIRRGELARTTAHQAMFRPYGRIVFMHMVVMGAGFASTLLGGTMLVLLLVVVLKTVIDIAAHFGVHTPFAELSQPEGAQPPRMR